jgi:hypothetical protein
MQGNARLLELKTGKTGIVKGDVPPATDWTKATVSVADPAWTALPPVQRDSANGATRFVFFRLYQGELWKQNAAAKSAFILAQPEVVAGRRKGALAGEPGNPTGLRLASLLDGFRTEVPAAIDGTTTGSLVGVTYSISGTLLDQRGGAVAGRSVLLFELQEDSGSVRVRSSRQTQRDGAFLFSGLPGGRLYRAEVAAGSDGLAARSSILRPAGAVAHVPLALRPVAETLSGVVLVGDEPAAGVEVRLASGTPLSDRTDQFGHFSLGPVKGDAAVVLIKPGSREGVRLNLPAGRREHLIPFDKLLPPPAERKSP